MTYPQVSLHIDGAWVKGAGGKSDPVLNPATGDPIGDVPHADKADLDRALAAAEKGFKAWRKVSAFDRYKLMRKAADIFRSRIDEIATILTQEQGKPLAEAKGGGQGRRRRHRLVRRGGAPRLRTGHSRARRGHLSDRGQGAGRSGRRLH